MTYLSKLFCGLWVSVLVRVEVEGELAKSSANLSITGRL